MSRTIDPRANGWRSDRGAVLPLVLIFSVAFAIVGVAIATYAATALRSSQVAEARVDRLAAAEAGMQEALLVAGASGACPTDADVADRNGAILTVSGCVQQTETVGEDAPYSLVVTARGLDPGTLAFVRRNSQSREVELGGQVFLSDAVTGSANPDRLIATGRVVAQAAECLSGQLPPPDWLGIDVGYAECTTQSWDEYTDVPVVDTSSYPAVSVTEPNQCTVIPAGTHGSLNVSGDVYFASGVHRITGPITLSGAVVAGHPGFVTLENSHRCQPAQAADEASGSASVGAVFVLEGGGNIEVRGNGTTVEFYGLNAGGRTLSLIAYANGYEAPNGVFATSTRDPDDLDQALLRIPNGAPNAAFSFFGEVWAPNGLFYLRQMSSSGAAGAAFQGGAVISRFEAWTSADVSGLIFTGDVAPVLQYYRLRVTATAEGSDTTVSVVARQNESGDLLVQSWRVL